MGEFVTWMQVMEKVRRLDERRRRGESLRDEEANTLVTMLLDFHEHVVEKVPTPSRPPPPSDGSRRTT